MCKKLRPGIASAFLLGLLVSCAPDPGSLSQNSSSSSGTDYSISPISGYLKYTAPSTIDQSYFGGSMAVGDFDADGIPDLAAGIFSADILNTNSGGVLIYYGSNTSDDSTREYYDAILQAPNTNNNEFGSALAVYDLDSDGYEDLIVGAPGEEPSNRGAVYVYYGSSSGLASSPTQILGEPNSTSSSGFGSALAVVDLDDDGRVELVVGSNLNDDINTNAGAVWIYKGLANGIFSSAQTTEITNSASAGSDYFGNSVAVLDYNGDDILDIVIGAPYAEAGGTDRGEFYVYYGTGNSATWVNDNTAPDVTVTNPLATNSDYFGFSLAAADITGDGKDDLLVGVPYSDQYGSNVGLALLYDDVQNGGSYGSIIPATTSSFSGTFSAYGIGIGDINGDGQVDVLVGTPYYSNDDSYASGRIDVYNASSNGVVYFAQSDAVYYPKANSDGTYNSFSDYFGYSICSGDVNGDGKSDLIVGAPVDVSKWSDDGAVYIYYSRSGGKYFNSPDLVLTAGGYRASNREYGSSCLVMDFNGDGNNDLLIGAENDDTGGTNGGAVYVHLGTGSGVTESPTLSIIDPGDKTSNNFGKSLAAGDINNDGFNDLVVGAYADDTGGTDRGIVYVFESDNTTGVIDTSSSTTFQTVLANSDYYGYSVNIMDFDGDGDSDLLVGAIGDDTQAADSGRVVVYLNAGTANTLLDTTADDYIYHPTNASNAYFGSAIASGKYSQSTYDDLIIGASYDDTVYTDGGAVYIYEGSASGPSSSASQSINGLDGSDSSSEGLGSSVTVFDFNNDGTLDLGIGAYLDDDTGINAGSVYIKVD